MKRVLTTKELEVPMSVMIEVADLLIENEIMHSITGTDEQEDTITITVEYAKDERDTIHEIEDLIDDHDVDEEEEEEDDDDDRR